MASGRMIALLGLLAVAGYQNRDKIGELLGRVRGDQQPNPAGTGATAAGEARTGGGGILDGIGNLFGGRASGMASGQDPGIGGFLGSLFGGTDRDGDGNRDGIGGGLRDLFDRFKGNGHEEEAKSWIETGPNRQIAPEALVEALGEDTLVELQQKTGLERGDLISRLREVLPMAVDQLTPEGRLPAPMSPSTATSSAGATL